MTRRDVAALVVRMAVEHPQWGDTRIRGALSHLGHEIARTPVKRILHDHGIDPAPERSRRMLWKTFLQAPWEGLTACDLVTVEVLTLAGFQRYLVFFVIALQSRRVTIAGIHPQPYGTWMEQRARNVTDPVDGCLRCAPYLIHDRDPLSTRGFGEILEGGGVQPIRLPPKSPNLNAYAERFVRSMKGECLSRVVPPRRRAPASPRGRVRRPRPSRAKPPGTRQPAPATTATAGEPGRRCAAAGASGRMAQFLPPGGRMSGRPIKRTLRGATVIIPPAKTANISGHGPRSPARDRTITWVKQLGRRRWKQVSGYHRQGRVENAFFRYTSIIGDGLRARSPAGQGSEVVLGCAILNRMTALGRPVSYRIGR